MLLLDHTAATPAENLALDEALLEEAEARDDFPDVLRLWEPADFAVIVGRSSKLAEEVDLAACRAQQVPVLRRMSGGAAVVAGPGCLMYAVLLGYRDRPALRAIHEAHRYVLERLAAALAPHLPGIRYQGTSDLTLDDAKFSGNSLRCRREHLLYHGTLLYNFPLERIETCLRMPPRQPDYRQGRAHGRFVRNLPLAAAPLRQSLIEAWQADTPLATWPTERMQQLVRERYSQESWHASR